MNISSDDLQEQQRLVQLKQSEADPEISTFTEYYESDGTRLALDVYIPNREKFPGIRPGILFFFGGGFWVGWRKAFQEQAKECAKQGYTAFCADYRIKSVHGSTPWDSMRDGAAAWRYVRENANRWQVSPQQIVLSGGSAGGLIALMGGKLTGIQPAGLALFNPAIPDGGTEADPLWSLIGSDKMRTVIDSLHPDPDMCPALILHGEDDQIVPVERVRVFAHSAAAMGRDVTLKIYPHMGHGFFNHFRDRAHFHLTVGELLIFLQGINKSVLNQGLSSPIQ